MSEFFRARLAMLPPELSRTPAAAILRSASVKVLRDDEGAFYLLCQYPLHAEKLARDSVIAAEILSYVYWVTGEAKINVASWNRE